MFQKPLLKFELVDLAAATPGYLSLAAQPYRKCWNRIFIKQYSYKSIVTLTLLSPTEKDQATAVRCISQTILKEHIK